jgi:hypothetical protein
MRRVCMHLLLHMRRYLPGIRNYGKAVSIQKENQLRLVFLIPSSAIISLYEETVKTGIRLDSAGSE